MTTPPASRPKETDRLDTTAWIEAGLEVLASAGIDAVRVEPLARRLGITKGSFYWHFKDRGDLLSAMLMHWRRQATYKIIERLERSGLTPLEKLRQLLDLPLRGQKSAQGSALELAIRFWGRSDPAAARAVEEVDRLRLLHVRDLVIATGVTQMAEAQGRAFLIYAYMLAEALLPQDLSEEAKAACYRLFDAPD